MTAELVTHHGQQLVGISLPVARAQPFEQSERDNRSGRVLIDGFGHGPAALTRIRHFGANVFEIRVFGKSFRREIEKPRTNDAAVPPDVRDLMNIEMEIRLSFQYCEALRVSLHESVLDAVMHHLH